MIKKEVEEITGVNWEIFEEITGKCWVTDTSHFPSWIEVFVPNLSGSEINELLEKAWERNVSRNTSIIREANKWHSMIVELPSAYFSEECLKTIKKMRNGLSIVRAYDFSGSINATSIISSSFRKFRKEMSRTKGIYYGERITDDYKDGKCGGLLVGIENPFCSGKD